MGAVYTNNFFQVGALAAGVGATIVPYAVVRNIHVANNTAGALTFRLYIGATGGTTAATAIAYDVSVAIGGVWDWYGAIEFRNGASEYLTGGGSGTGLVLTVTGEVGAV
jgi:hypothetical protein